MSEKSIALGLAESGAFSPDGNLLAVTGYGPRIRVYDMSRRRDLWRRGVVSHPRTLLWSASGDALFVIGIYRKDLKILVDSSTSWIRDFWSPGLNEAVWRIEIVFQRCHLRKAGIRDLLPESMQRAWEWALIEILRQVRGPQENLTPLWRMLLAVMFVLPWDASNAPVLPAAPQVPDDSRIRSMTTQGVVGLGRRTARAQGVPLLDSRGALHQALDVAIDRRPGLLDVFETAMEHECRKLALPRLRRAQRRSDGTWIVWTTSTPADADWGELGLCGLLDDCAPEEAVDDDGDQGTDSSTEETRTS